MTIILFEDELVEQLYPITIGRPAFAISCGGYRLIDLVGQLGHNVRAIVRPHLVELVKADYPSLAGDGSAASDGTLLLNSRLVPSAAVVGQLKAIVAAGRPGVIRSGESVCAALLPPGSKAPSTVAELSSGQFFAQLGAEILKDELPLYQFPHEIIRYHLAILEENLAHRIGAGEYQEIAESVFAAPGAVLGKYVVTETKHGPIVLDAGATVGPYCYLSGPAYLGSGSRVLEHAALKDGVAIGHTTKVGGEVEASIIEPYTNKQHHGFLGHSYLGSWINLGAGTCNSDLKNTYGQVNMEYRGRKVGTGMQFVGAIVGDYAKTAINTGIFTGKTIGVCSMVYGFVTTNVPSFVNYARLFGQVTEAPVEIMIATQRRMFERRGVSQRPCDIQLLHDMYALTAHERQLPGETISIEPLSL